MSVEIEVRTVDEEGEEVVLTLPGKHEVCGRCEGHGTHLNESIGQHCYTQEEFDEEFSEEESRDAYFRRGGMYDVQCVECKGLRVVPVVDLTACRTEEHKRALALLEKQERDDADYERLVRSEIAFGC